MNFNYCRKRDILYLWAQTTFLGKKCRVIYFNERKPGIDCKGKSKAQKWNYFEVIFYHSMKATADSLQFCELSSVAEKEHFKKDIMT